ncbi:MAG TPA: hypothetical protein VL122_00030 [Nitrospirota bacterium]|nr:hypothetical protein [Nitrospirota bacterium]
MNKKMLVAVLSAAMLMISTGAALAEDTHDSVRIATVRLPLVHCWYKGQVAYYIQTEASDPGVAAQQGVNYVPQLANTINAPGPGGAVDDIYAVTNFKQGNVIPSAPIPAGPNNANSPPYSPLWQVSLVTWNPGTTPYTLKSEEEVLAAKADGMVTIVKTNIVVNCPVIFTPVGGLLPTAKIFGADID